MKVGRQSKPRKSLKVTIAFTCIKSYTVVFVNYKYIIKSSVFTHSQYIRVVSCDIFLRVFDTNTNLEGIALKLF